MTYYDCPACAERTEVDADSIVNPGSCEWTCPKCETKFRIDTQFYPVEDQ